MSQQAAAPSMPGLASGDHNPAKELAALMLRSAPSPATREAATALFAFSVWQARGCAMTPVIPSLLLVNAGPAARDPLDAFAASHFFGEIEFLEQSLREDPIVDGGKGMALALAACKVTEREVPREMPWYDQRIRENAEVFEEFRSRDYGEGPAGRYARCWHPQYGWLSNWSNRLLLRIDRDEDRKAFLSDVMDQPGRLLEPKGIGPEMVPENKSLCLSGTLRAEEWSEPLVSRLLEWGWPVIFLPHTAATEPQPVSIPDLFLAFRHASDTRRRSIVNTPILPDYRPDPQGFRDDWRERYLRLLRGRLRHMPAEYELQILLIDRALDHASLLIAHSAFAGGPYFELMGVLANELHGRLRRTLTLGVWALGYHGWGFHAPWPRQKVVALLEYLRQRQAVTFRDLQRRFHVTAQECREIVECVKRQGLVTCRGRKVTAVPLGTFVDALHHNPAFPPCSEASAILLGESAASLGITVQAVREILRKNKPPRKKKRPKATGDQPAAEDAAPGPLSHPAPGRNPSQHNGLAGPHGANVTNRTAGPESRPAECADSADSA